MGCHAESVEARYVTARPQTATSSDRQRAPASFAFYCSNQNPSNPCDRNHASGFGDIIAI